MNFTTLLQNTTSDFKFKVTSEIQRDNAETTDPSPILDDFVYYSEAVVQTTILCFGFIFNVINLIVLKRSKISKMFQLCLLTLTITDLWACFFGVIQLIVEVVAFRGKIPFGYWYEAALATHLLYYTFLLCMCISSTYVIMVASVRAYMIVRPYKASEKLQPRKIKIILLVILVTDIVLFLPTPLYAVWQVCYKESEEQFCFDYFHHLPNVEVMQYYLYALSVIFGPLIIIANVVCLITIKRALKKSQDRLTKLNKKEEKKHKHYQRITRMLLIILILDTIWLLPTCIQYLGLALSPENTVFNSTDPAFVIYDIVAEILLLFRPTYNIFVYLTTNREYRRSFFALFSCSELSSPGSSELNESSSNLKHQSNEALNGISKSVSEHDVKAKVKVTKGKEEDSHVSDALQTDSDSGTVLSPQEIYILPKENDKK